MPGVSVIVPVYNTERYLRRCIESILHQTYQNFELILVDDGSTDQSRNICSEYADLDKRIKLIHQKNRGVAAARNAALDVATGQYIAFCDSDDSLELETLNVMCNTMLDDKCDCVCIQYKKINPDNSVDTKKSFYHV